MIKVSVQEAAAVMGKSEENIRKMARREKLKSQKIDGKVFILLDDGYAAKLRTLKANEIERTPDVSRVVGEMRIEIERLKKENHSLITSVQKLTKLLEKSR